MNSWPRGLVVALAGTALALSGPLSIETFTQSDEYAKSCDVLTCDNPLLGTHCLDKLSGQAPGSLEMNLAQLEQCLMQAGCWQVSLAKERADWIRCVSASYAGDNPSKDVFELRRRDDTTAQPKVPATSAAGSAETDSKAAPLRTADTTSPKTQASPVTSSTLSTVASTESSSAPTSTDLLSATSSLVCLATSHVPFSFCTTTTLPQSSTSVICTTTTTPSVSCASGLICKVADSGVTLCMRKDNHLTLSGLIVTIVFASVVVAMISSLCFMCAMDRRRARKLAAIATGEKVGSGAPTRDQSPAGFGAPAPGPSRLGHFASTSDAYLPLMSTAGPAGGAFVDDDEPHSHGASPVPSLDNRPSEAYRDSSPWRTAGTSTYRDVSPALAAGSTRPASLSPGPLAGLGLRATSPTSPAVGGHEEEWDEEDLGRGRLL
jgi:hypothetical protein